MEATKHMLKENGIKPSIQRIKIFDYLASRKDHPSVEIIFTALAHEIPTLSKTTVYNTLKGFVEAGIAKPIMIEDNEIRYDADISMHGHFKCESCEMIFDFFADFSKFESPEIKNFIIREKHFYLKGLCTTCQTQSN